jgi:hypothetical protein
MNWEPTNELRFVIRIGLHSERGQPAGEQAYRILQQKWVLNDYKHVEWTVQGPKEDREPSKFEWRDVPEVQTE